MQVISALENTHSFKDQDMQALHIKILQQADFGLWDAFVENSACATFFHKAGWKTVLERAFGHKTHYLYAQEQGDIVGILPLAEIKSVMFGHSLSSTPFCVYGGVIGVSPEVEEQLVNRAVALAENLGVDYLELRNRSRKQPDWPCKELYFTFRKDISDSEDENLKAIPRKQRAVVRKAIALELESTFEDDIESFYTAYSTSVRNLGTPVFSKKYFQILKEVFGDEVDLLTISKEGELIASVMNFYFRDEVLPYYGGGTEAARKFKGNDYMYWRLMCHAAEKGVKVFDYGRSKQGTGAYSFKKNWGFEPQPLYYEYFLVNAKDMPDVNPLNPKYQLMIKTWKKMPLWLSQIVGPMVSKYLG